jgi:hypothetical protein
MVTASRTPKKTPTGRGRCGRSQERRLKGAKANEVVVFPPVGGSKLIFHYKALAFSADVKPRLVDRVPKHAIVKTTVESWVEGEESHG